MFELFMSGGWLMFPILGCSIVALAIIAERLLVLQQNKVVPTDVVPMIIHNLQNKNFSSQLLKKTAETSVLGQVLVQGLLCLGEGTETIKERMQEAGRHAMMELERHLNFLGTIAAIAPLLGLLGTVTGMIQMFSSFTLQGASNPEGLAGGISQALLTTAFGLLVAIPSLMFHRFFHRRIDEFAICIEREALNMVDKVKKLEKR